MEFIWCAALLLGLSSVDAAGRAFPVDAENYVVDRFREINPYLEYDRTNFLVDLSGQHVSCDITDRAGFVSVNRYTPEGDTILGISGAVKGDEAHSDAVTMYIKYLVDEWMKTPSYFDQIRGADRFGCSVKPLCSGYSTVVCLFSPAHQSDEPNDIGEKTKARAFTPEQYSLAEDITGHKWDRSHFLENLSGLETDCAMMGRSDWPFAAATAEAAARSYHISGLYDYAVNYGSTEEAMVEILSRMKVIRGNAEVGCSLIPDCYGGRGDIKEMFVVISCIFLEDY
ncbi:hypothetical protein CAPTEDRAFT_180550 [Capitella teleta]|uniref:SCP domain-containing protein n=1 Tax=Capitella teleta TaxID=283909 RepID=R7VE71_CAPTE|nr:hypothetical protein CAPTEDRAFT_180550 [Capitella teleta]|eukprot:ELU14596.1 hypothetical protein CAPTEDRAFT_180550 [Capitella teleta]